MKINPESKAIDGLVVEGERTPEGKLVIDGNELSEWPPMITLNGVEFEYDYSDDARSYRFKNKFYERAIYNRYSR